eukprot:TRINITY_DN838_c0_g1_i2.p1 TRINITY_DN838_c0_g1~~TRINITY_DN838_c0_g1_i2.p1  ORF type:complete len:251 (-),score=19.87 TRINITY_DN838_c0_g1_i2:270-1022(-)
MASAFGFSEYASAYPRWDYGSLKNFNRISPHVQNHLKRVYLTLCCALVTAAVGVYLHLLWNIGGILTAIGGIATLFWLFSIPPVPYNEAKRLKLLMACALLNGASMGPLVDIVITVDPSILLSAFVGSALVFACFSAAAILAQRREYLFLGGFLASGLSILMWLQFVSTLFGSSDALYTFEVYLGLVLFLGYIIFDTQMIIERAYHGDYDYIHHSLDLFTNFVAVFVRMLVIMMKHAVSKSEEKKKKRMD